MVWISAKAAEDEDFKYLRECVPALQLRAALADSHLDYLSSLHIRSKPCLVRLCGIICKIGIATREIHVIEKLIENGMNIAYLDCAHGSFAYHCEVLENIKTAICNVNEKIKMTCPIATALGLTQPVLRISFPIAVHSYEMKVYEEDILYISGDFEFVCKESKGEMLYLNYENIHDIQVGKKIIIDDKSVILECIQVEEKVVICKVIKPGYIRNGQSVSLPETLINLPELTAFETEYLHIAMEKDLDVVIARHEIVKEIRKILAEDVKLMIIAQVSCLQGLDQIDEIIKDSDGILIRRDNLGNEIDDTELFLVQKSVISKCNKVGKPVICTAQMFESMVARSRPTNPESTDVANAVLDGVDCIMLAHETEWGQYPIAALKKAADVCRQAESAVWNKKWIDDITNRIESPMLTIHAVATAAVQISLQLLASAIVIVSSSLISAQLLSQYRPKCPIIAITRNVKKARCAHFFRGVLPVVYKGQMQSDWCKDEKLRISYGINFGRRHGIIRPGDPVVAMFSSQQGCGFTDTMKILYVSKRLTHGSKCTC